MSKRAGARDEGLSLERVVGAAIELLDEEGEEGLTFRALATRLASGAGAIYWHIGNKGELLVAATDDVVSRAIAGIPCSGSPEDAIRGIALAIFDAVDEHPWLGAQLSRAPWETPVLQIFERLGREVQALGVRGSAQLTATSAFLSSIVAVSTQNAARRTLPPTLRWKTLDPEQYPFLRKIATQVADHADREELLAGIELILAGIAHRSGSIR
jgi:AcrR family transcriptional regulator